MVLFLYHDVFVGPRPLGPSLLKTREESFLVISLLLLNCGRLQRLDIEDISNCTISCLSYFSVEWVNMLRVLLDKQSRLYCYRPHSTCNSLFLESRVRLVGTVGSSFQNRWLISNTLGLHTTTCRDVVHAILRLLVVTSSSLSQTSNFTHTIRNSTDYAHLSKMINLPTECGGSPHLIVASFTFLPAVLKYAPSSVKQ